MSGIEPSRQPVRHGVESRLMDVGRVGVVGRQRMPVRHEDEAGIAILQLHPVLHRSEVVAEVDAAGRS